MLIPIKRVLEKKIGNAFNGHCIPSYELTLTDWKEKRKRK